MTTITAIFHAYGPEYIERSANVPYSHLTTIQAIWPAEQRHTAPVSLPVKAVDTTTASLMPVVIDIVRSANTTKHRCGSTTTWRRSCQGPIFS